MITQISPDDEQVFEFYANLFHQTKYIFELNWIVFEKLE